MIDDYMPTYNESIHVIISFDYVIFHRALQAMYSSRSVFQ